MKVALAASGNSATFSAIFKRQIAAATSAKTMFNMLHVAACQAHRATLLYMNIVTVPLLRFNADCYLSGALDRLDCAFELCTLAATGNSRLS